MRFKSEFLMICFRSLEGRLLVRCGEWDTQDVMAVEETLAYQERDVMTVKVNINEYQTNETN